MMQQQIEQLFDLTGKVALVTGAGMGIGRGHRLTGEMIVVDGGFLLS